MITVSGLAKSFGGQSLFEDVSLELAAPGRYGVVGANGCGKSTLLRILSGEESCQAGSVHVARGIRLGFLRQDLYVDDSRRIVDVAMAGDADAYNALRELDQLGQDVPADRQAELTETLERCSGYTLEARASQVLSGLGIDNSIQKQPLGSLSGGFKLRVQLARVLLERADVLLLDEPTNHLDLPSIRWLQDTLAGFRGCLLLVSHDQEFLNGVCNQILDVDYQTVSKFTGNYDQYLEQRTALRAQKEQLAARAEKAIAEKKAFIERFKAKASKARQAQSRVKQLERIEVEELKASSRRYPMFRFEPARPSGRDVLVVKGLSKSYGKKRVLADVSFSMRRGDRLGIVGANGAGKSTLLKLLAGVAPSCAGETTWGHEARLGYFPQDHSELLAGEAKTPLDFIWGLCPQEGSSFVRGHLGRVLLSGDAVDKPLSALSGGEASRLLLCRLSVLKPNVLLLDEPTNHLDFEAIEALTSALLAFPGSLLVVSHNRYFVNRVCSRVVEVRDTGVVQYEGGYAQYLEATGTDLLDRSAAMRRRKDTGRRLASTPNASESQSPAASEASSASTGPSWEEQKRLRNRQKALPRLQEDLLERVTQAEQEVAGIDEQLCHSSFVKNPGPGELAALQARKEQAVQRVETLTAEWEALEEEADELAGALGREPHTNAGSLP